MYKFLPTLLVALGPNPLVLPWPMLWSLVLVDPGVVAKAARLPLFEGVVVLEAVAVDNLPRFNNLIWPAQLP
jgi:hypothetical protein